MEIARDKNNNHMQAVVIDTAYNVDETKALLHEEIYNELVPQIEPLSEEGEPIVYPYPLLDNQMVEALLETSEWSNPDE